MQIVIDNTVESTDYSIPNKPVRMVTIHYHTDTGYKGAKLLPKDQVDPKTIGEILKRDAETVSGLIGTTLNL